MMDDLESSVSISSKTEDRSAKKLLWNVAAYLSPFVYAAILAIWPHFLPLLAIIAAGIVIALMFLTAVALHMRDLGGWKWAKTYAKEHLWLCIAAMMLLCCLISVTCTYFIIESRSKKATASKVTAYSDLPAQPAKMLGTAPSPKPTTAAPPKTKLRSRAALSAAPTSSQNQPPNAQHAQPTYEQNCEGSACAQGQGSQAILNQYGAPKLAMTQAQARAISSGMKTYAGKAVLLTEEMPVAPDVAAFAQALAGALGSDGAGMIVEGPKASMSVNAVVSPGLTYWVGSSRVDEAKTLNHICFQNHLSSSDEPVIVPLPYPDAFHINISSK